MSTYDELVCNYPLPGSPPAFIKAGHAFQTKDFDCQLQTYTIHADGSFSKPDFSGVVHFYTTNWSINAYGFTFTLDGTDWISVEYEAEFAKGRLKSLVEISHESSPALPTSAYYECKLFPKPKNKADFSVGNVLYLLLPGQDDGYWAEIEAISRFDVCFRTLPDGGLEMQDARCLEGIAFASEADARAMRKHERDGRARQVAVWQEMLDQRAAGSRLHSVDN